jgi:hypothetical protein
MIAIIVYILIQIALLVFVLGVSSSSSGSVRES